MAKNFLRAVLSLSVLAVLRFTIAAEAADCPSAASLQDGFTLQARGGKSDVLRSKGPVTRVVNTYNDHPKQTVFYFRGLIELYRTSPAGQRAAYPLADLGTLFPLERGDRHSLQLVSMTPDRVPGAPLALELEVTGKEELGLGKCRYDVLVIKQV